MCAKWLNACLFDWIISAVVRTNYNIHDFFNKSCLPTIVRYIARSFNTNYDLNFPHVCSSYVALSQHLHTTVQCYAIVLWGGKWANGISLLIPLPPDRDKPAHGVLALGSSTWTRHPLDSSKHPLAYVRILHSGMSLSAWDNALSIPLARVSSPPIATLPPCPISKHFSLTRSLTKHNLYQYTHLDEPS